MGPSRLLTDNDTAADAGLSSESEATIILRQNIVTCSYKGEFARFVYEDNDDDDDNDDDAHVLYDLYDFVDDDDDEDDDLDLHHSESLFVVQITNGATTCNNYCSKRIHVLQLVGKCDHPRFSDPDWERSLCRMQLVGKCDHPRLSDRDW